MPAQRYRTFAGYNRWANSRLYEFASHLSPDQYKADRGAFFRSVHGTLNHLLVADRVWMRRFTGTGDAPSRLDTILFDDFAALSAARETEDERIVDYVESLDDATLARDLRHTNMSGDVFSQPLDELLDHFFNHQTHHRGQAHAVLTHFLGNERAASLDLISFQRAIAASRGAANAPKA